jgi:hypothetical protein
LNFPENWGIVCLSLHLALVTTRRAPAAVPSGSKLENLIIPFPRLRRRFAAGLAGGRSCSGHCDSDPRACFLVEACERYFGMWSELLRHRLRLCSPRHRCCNTYRTLHHHCCNNYCSHWLQQLVVWLQVVPVIPGNSHVRNVAQERLRKNVSLFHRTPSGVPAFLTRCCPG